MSITTLRSRPEELIRYLLEGTSSKTGALDFLSLGGVAQFQSRTPTR